MKLFPPLIASRHKRIFLACTLLLTSQAIYSLQPASKQLARVAPRAAQAARPAATRALVRPITTVPSLAAARPHYEQSWRQQQSGNAGPGNFGKVLSAGVLTTVGILAANQDQRPLTTDQALKLVREHAQEVIKHMHEHEAVQFRWLPGYIIKRDPASRKAGEKILRDCIAEYNLDLLVVPQKTSFSLSNGEYHDLCLCERIEGTDKGRINVRQMRQVITLLEKAPYLYCDLRPDNVIFTEDGKIAFIDTERRSFCVDTEFASEYEQLWGQHEVLKQVWFLFSFEHEAKQLLRQKINELNDRLAFLRSREE